ncbi:Cytoskeleton-associated protein and related proteins [Plasmopara halstedii]|uniref:Cytoskeleton-associated protein and related proteins n=1 Tax=Plasmopara halstedii TaxID=4781 RepID=A0A0N7L4F3_PLAHL|nr:Cytoskeleton-associated protein and related proteins [Plasmopara halstedii]CEG38515.1 Cytoskeleton-associated protein and related proteins [Plasmopara halstedii]|eukprot:XP_024574884.1 Cytoskeleton-associated protein and related proteins [Plasmopara halstedii]
MLVRSTVATANKANERISLRQPHEDEDDDLPMLECNRASYGTPHEPNMLLSTVNEPIDGELEGQMHVWVYEARQLTAPCAMTDAVYDQYRFCIRCTLFGAMQQSSCNNKGNKSNPVWRQAENESRDGTCGHFVWTFGSTENGVGKGRSITGDISACELNIEIICGESVVTSAIVPLQEFLLASKNNVSGVSRLGSHWLPLARNTGLLNISLEFASRHTRTIMFHGTGATSSHTDMVVYPRKNRTVPRHTQESTKVQSSNDIVVSKTGGVTLYIPTHEKKSTNTKDQSLKARPEARKTSATMSDDQLEKQLQDLYNFGISNKVPERRDSDTISVTSDYSCDHSNLSRYSRQPSTCASDVLVYNELIQDMESVLKCTNDSSSRKDKNSAFSKFHMKSRRSSRRPLNLTKPFDRIQSLWQGAKHRGSNASNSSIEHHSRRKRDSCVSSTISSPIPASPINEGGIILFGSQNLPSQVPLQRSTSRDHVHETATRAERNAAAGQRRRSLPVNTFSLEYRQEMLQQHQRKRAQRKQIEAQLLKSTLLSNADPLLLHRSESLHSLTDMYLSKTGDVHSVQVTMPAIDSASNRSLQKSSTSRTSARRHSGSNVVYINGAPLCIGKIIHLGTEPGVVRYIGTTRFATGTWVGIELCKPKGKNNGTVDGHRYFSCAPDHGIFIRASRLELSAQ